MPRNETSPVKPCYLPDVREEEAWKLRALKIRLPRYDEEGDVHAAIEAQIWTLEKNASEHEMMEEATAENWSNYVYDAAVEAVRWLTWAQYAAPSERWEKLSQKQSALTK